MDRTLPLHDVDWEKEVPYVFGGLEIVIEYLAGDVRSKTYDGVDVVNTMPAAYGRILGTTDGHGEEIDMYLASSPREDAIIYVIDQIKPTDGQFDEHKVMLGFDSIDEVVHTYYSVFGDNSGPSRLGAIASLTPEQFHNWIDTEGTSLKPAADYLQYTDNVTSFVGIKKPMSAKSTPAPRDAAGGVSVDLPDLSGGPKIKTSSGGDGSYDYHLYLYSALDIKTWSNTIDVVCRLLDFASAKDKLHIHIASPGGSVILMGRFVSAIATTQARVITYAEGSVASAATTIWSAGHERHILPGAFFMQHMSSQLLMGKTTDIAAKSIFCMEYIKNMLMELVVIGLFTSDEIDDMVDKSSDIYISGREAMTRVGAISYQPGKE